MPKRWTGGAERGAERVRRASGRGAGLATALFAAIVAALVALSLGGCGAAGLGATTQGPPAGAEPAASEPQGSGQPAYDEGEEPRDAAVTVARGEPYTSKEEIAAYLHEYGELPPNFISKTRARAAGWVPSEGNLDEVCPGKSIGGGVFHNDDHALPEARGRTWRECDVDYHGGARGPERIVYSDDGLIYYTSDHYRTFEQLY
ncbi:MAG: ribonuclease domain-containing protein [Olsenella sp.]